MSSPSGASERKASSHTANVVSQPARVKASAQGDDRAEFDLDAPQGWRWVESPAKTQYDVRIAARPAQRLHGLESATTADHLDVDTAAACLRLDALLSAAGATAGPFVGIFPLDLEDSLVLRVGVPTEYALDGTSPSDLPGGSWASTLHVGGYDLLPLAYSALLDHVHERGHEPGGIVCESYLTDPDTVAEEELVTALALPLAS